MSHILIRRYLALLAAAYLLAVSVGLPVAETRDLLDASVAPASSASSSGRTLVKALRLGNPDEDLSDAIPVGGLVVFPSAVPLLDVPREAPGAPAGEPEALRPRVLGTRGDFERGPPTLA
jgi:hypothetical protein